MTRAREYLECINNHEGGAIKTDMEVFFPLGLIKISRNGHTHTQKAQAENTEMIES